MAQPSLQARQRGSLSSGNGLSHSSERVVPRYPPNGQPEPASLGLPHSWSWDFHEHWSAVPEQLRPYLHQRETEAQRRITELGGRAKLSDEVGRAFEKYGVQLPQGLGHDRAVEMMLAAHHALRNESGPGDRLSCEGCGR